MCDVEKRIEQWRASLTDSDALSPSDINELESHLREEIDRLKNSGLSDDEAFIVARRRLGDVSALEAEFAKAHPYRRLTYQLYWMVVGILGYLLAARVSTLAASVSGAFGYIIGLRSVWLALLATTVHVTAFAVIVALAIHHHARDTGTKARDASSAIRTGGLIALAVVGLWWIMTLVNPILYQTMPRDGFVNVLQAWHWAGFGWEMLMPFLLATAMVILSMRCKPDVQNQQ